MEKKYVVLIADRNPHIRNFVRRELTFEGYHVFTVENVSQLKSWIMRTARRLDALVLDPNMPGIDSREEVRDLLLLRPTLPVVFHCFSPDSKVLRGISDKVVFVEKSGQSIDDIKKEIELLLASPVST